MANPILGKKPDRALKKTIGEVLRDRVFSEEDLITVLKSAWKDDRISDVEYRDLKRFMRTERRLSEFHRLSISTFLAMTYPLEGPFIYPGDVDDLEGADQLGNRACAKLVQLSQPIGVAADWREGIRVRGNGALIQKGTAVATFEDGFYPNRNEHNHVAYYMSQDTIGVTVMDQYPQADKPKISSRVMPFKPQNGNGLYTDPSNNGAALSVIMRKRK